MQVLTLADDTDLVENVFFPATYCRFAIMLDWLRLCLLEGLAVEN